MMKKIIFTFFVAVLLTQGTSAEAMGRHLFKQKSIQTMRTWSNAFKKPMRRFSTSGGPSSNLCDAASGTAIGLGTIAAGATLGIPMYVVDALLCDDAGLIDNCGRGALCGLIGGFPMSVIVGGPAGLVGYTATLGGVVALKKLYKAQQENSKKNR